MLQNINLRIYITYNENIVSFNVLHKPGVVGLDRGPLSLVNTIEELLGRKVTEVCFLSTACLLSYLSHYSY
jgi:hypothetical protein